MQNAVISQGEKLLLRTSLLLAGLAECTLGLPMLLVSGVNFPDSWIGVAVALVHVAGGGAGVIYFLRPSRTLLIVAIVGVVVWSAIAIGWIITAL